jgi:hypothetical protein
LTYVWLDKFFDPSEILGDIGKRPFITIGFTSLMLMVPLAATSTARLDQATRPAPLAVVASADLYQRPRRRDPLLLACKIRQFDCPLSTARS